MWQMGFENGCHILMLLERVYSNPNFNLGEQYSWYVWDVRKGTKHSYRIHAHNWITQIISDVE